MKFKHPNNSFVQKVNILVPVLITAVIFVVYANTFSAPFVFDDLISIIENDEIRILSLHDIWGLLGESRPVAIISFALNYYFGKLNVFGYHLVNTLIHILTAVSLYFFLTLTLGLPGLKDSYRQSRHFIAASAALLFACHPINTQAVTYIVQRMASLGTLFYLGSIICYIRGRQSMGLKSKLFYALALLCGLLSVGSKQNMVTLPFFIALYEYFFFLKLDFSQVMQRKAFFLALVVLPVLAIIIYLFFAIDLGSVLRAGYEHYHFTPGQRVLTELRVVCHYLSLLIVPWPTRLNLDYEFPLSYSLLQPTATLLASIILLGLMFLAVFLARRERLISFGILWFLGNLVLESSILPLGLVYEHRLYLPSIGFFLVAAVLLWHLARRLASRDAIRLRGWVIISALVLVLGVLTYQRNLVWADSYRLWSDVARKSPHKPRVRDNLGLAYTEKGLYDKAISEFNTALQLDPEWFPAYNNLGVVYIYQGRNDEAIAALQQAIKLKPDYVSAMGNLGIAYHNKGLYDEAITCYKGTLKLSPREDELWVKLGITYNFKGLFDKAIAAYGQALKLKPHSVEAMNNLGTVYNNKGMYHKSIPLFQQVLGLEPNFEATLYNLRLAQFKQILEADPDDVETHFKLGVMYQHRGLGELAAKEYKTALILNPNFELAAKMLQDIPQAETGESTLNSAFE